MTQVEVTAVVASTHAIKKYDGRFRLTRDDLEDMVAKYEAGVVQMNYGHDPSKPGRTEVLSAHIEPTDDGEWRLVVNFSVDEESWNAFVIDAEARGVTNPGMSYSRTVPFCQTGEGDAVVLVAGDAAAYSQSDILAAARSLPSDLPVVAAEYVEFGLIDEVVNVLVVWQQHPEVQNFEWATFGGLVYPVLQRLARVGRRIRYRIQVRRANDTHVDIVSEIDTAEELAAFVERIGELEQRVDSLESELYEWREGSWWRRLRSR